MGIDYRTSTELGETEILRGHKQTFVRNRTQGIGVVTPERQSQTCLCVVGSLLQRHDWTVACHRVWGTAKSTPGRLEYLHMSSWRRSPLAHHRATEQMTHELENNHTKDILALL